MEINMSEVSLGNMYELNKTAVAAEKPLKSFEIKDKLRKVKEFFKDSNDKYFMLLCRERYDFTLFNLLNKNDLSLASGIKELKECLENRGAIISIDLTENKDAYEIWIKIDDEPFVYYLFPYDLGVIEVM
jgi:hypothetical protein